MGVLVISHLITWLIVALIYGFFIGIAITIIRVVFNICKTIGVLVLFPIACVVVAGSWLALQLLKINQWRWEQRRNRILSRMEPQFVVYEEDEPVMKDVTPRVRRIR